MIEVFLIVRLQVLRYVLDPLNHSVLKANCESASIMLNMLESKWPDFNQNFFQVLACAT